MNQVDPHDPKGLVREAYAIEGITPGECRSIFLDWALSLPLGTDPGPPARVLLTRHATPDHPMSAVLRDALAVDLPARRRGGRAARVGS